ncbi:MAG: hypothetical protein SNJ82_05675 [Gemmataceae bacterium]
MSTTYISTIEVNVWKEHTCVHCGTRYRYLFKRTVKGTGNTPDAATTNAHNSVLRSLEHEVELQPCPGCGSYQPDMIANQRSSRHWLVLWCSLSVLALVVLLTCYDVLTSTTAAWVLGILAGVTLLGNLLIDLINLNANTAANLELAQRREADGDLWVPQGIRDNGGDPVGSGINMGHYVGYGLLFLAILAFFTPALILWAIGGRGNAGWYPQVLGPGDEGYVYFDKQIICVNGHWRGHVNVMLLNTKELGLDGEFKPVQGRTRQDGWGQTITINRRGSKTSSPTLYAYIAIPEDPRLVGKTLDLQIEMIVNYPRLIGNDLYDDRHHERVVERHQVVLSSVRAGLMCQRTWWVALLVGFVCFTAGGIVLPLASQAFAKQAEPTKIFDPFEARGQSREDDEDETSEDDQAEDRRRRLCREDDY